MKAFNGLTCEAKSNLADGLALIDAGMMICAVILQPEHAEFFNAQRIAIAAYVAAMGEIEELRAFPGHN